MRPKTLSREEELDIQRLYHNKFHEKNWKSSTQLWYDVILDFFSRKFKGSMLIPQSVREMENKVLQHEDLCREYVSALMKVVGTDLVQITEHQKMVLLMTATGDEREEALYLIQS